MYRDHQRHVQLKPTLLPCLERMSCLVRQRQKTIYYRTRPPRLPSVRSKPAMPWHHNHRCSFAVSQCIEEICVCAIQSVYWHGTITTTRKACLCYLVQVQVQSTGLGFIIDADCGRQASPRLSWAWAGGWKGCKRAFLGSLATMHVSEKQPNSDLSYRRCLWVPYVRICTIKSHTDDSGVMIVKAYLFARFHVCFGHDVFQQEGDSVEITSFFQRVFRIYENPFSEETRSCIYRVPGVLSIRQAQHVASHRGTLVDGLVLFCRFFSACQVNFGSLPLQLFEGGEGTFQRV